MTEEQKTRYSRHLLLPEVGEAGQERLLASSVLIVGAGGLASPVAMYLAASGVGTIGIVDRDDVDLSNLQRQVVHFTRDVGCPKVNSAADKMLAINPQCHVETYNCFLTVANAEEIISRYDFVVEATDNVESRYLVNDVCVSLGKPFCIGGVSHCSGQVMTCVPGSLSYRNLFPDPRKVSEAPLPVLGPVVGILGTIMATEVVKYLSGIGRLLTNRLLTFDALTMDFQEVDLF